MTTYLADLVLYNGNFITLDPGRPRATSVAVAGGRIIAVGGDDLREIACPSGRVDLGGNTVVPGFNDAHNHVLTFGLGLSHIDLGYPNVKSTGDILALVRLRAESSPTGAWVLGAGYDDGKLVEGRGPTCEELDLVAPRHPVVLKHNSGHMSIANSCALGLAGVTAETPDPPGGRIIRDSRGRLTGLLQEGAQRPVWALLSPKSVDEMIEGLRLASDRYLSEGITSCSEAGALRAGPHELKAYLRARDEGKLNVRIYLMVSVGAFRRIPGHSFDPTHFGLDGGIRTGFGDEWLKIGPMKIFADGSLIGRTAAMEEPFANEEGNCGFFTTDPEELRRDILDAHVSGWQVAVHAIGDRAIGTTLDIYEQALSAAPRGDHRHRIEHCGVVNETIIRRLGRMGVIPVPQQPFISELGDGFVRSLGPERARLCYPMRSMLDAGLPIPGSSDRPVVNGHPLLGIHDAVNQLTQSGRPYQPQEAITPEEALRCYTLHSAHASFEERLKGSIEAGKLADMTVLSEDLTTVDPGCIKDIKILATIVGGSVKYSQSGWAR